MEFYNTLKPVAEFVCGGIILLEGINAIHIIRSKKKGTKNESL